LAPDWFHCIVIPDDFTPDKYTKIIVLRPTFKIHYKNGLSVMNPCSDKKGIHSGVIRNLKSGWGGHTFQVYIYKVLKI